MVIQVLSYSLNFVIEFLWVIIKASPFFQFLPIYLTSDTHPYEKNILRVGGYEKTGCWVDRKNQLIGTLFSQVNESADRIGLGSEMENDFKQELYRQLSNYE